MIITVEREGVEMEVEFRVISPYKPAKTNCRNDDARPAEAAEYEIISVNGEEADEDLKHFIIEDHADEMDEACRDIGRGE